jgi:hypothetical protein
MNSYRITADKQLGTMNMNKQDVEEWNRLRIVPNELLRYYRQ